VAARAVHRREERDDARAAAIGHPHLGAIEHVAVALADRRRLHGGGVGAGAGLGNGERGGDLARGEARQIAALLLVGAVGDDRVAGGVLHEIDDGTGGARPRDLLDRQAECHRAEPGATVRLGNVEAHEPLAAEEVELLRGITLGLVDVRGQGRDALARQRTGEVTRLPFFLSEPEGVRHRLPYALYV
jgi:hypothetical protein